MPSPIGINNLRSQLQTAYNVQSLKQVQSQLNTIAMRIVPEGDVVRHERGGKVRCHSLEPKTVRDALDFLDTLVGHLEGVS